MRRQLLAAGGAVLIAGITYLAWTAVVSRNPAPGDTKLARGAAIYAEACASCHGANLEGEPDWRSPGPDGRLPAPPHDSSGHTWHHSDRVLMAITNRGTAAVVGRGYESNMPRFSDQYSDDDLRVVLDWIKGQWPERERAFQAEITSRDQIQQ